jgi:hypothetical protein
MLFWIQTAWISDCKFLNSKFKAILDGGFWMAQGEVFE